MIHNTILQLHLHLLQFSLHVAKIFMFATFVNTRPFYKTFLIPTTSYSLSSESSISTHYAALHSLDVEWVPAYYRSSQPGFSLPVKRLVSALDPIPWLATVRGYHGAYFPMTLVIGSKKMLSIVRWLGA